MYQVILLGCIITKVSLSYFKTEKVHQCHREYDKWSFLADPRENVDILFIIVFCVRRQFTLSHDYFLYTPHPLHFTRQYNNSGEVRIPRTSFIWDYLVFFFFTFIVLPMFSVHVEVKKSGARVREKSENHITIYDSWIM